MSESRYQKDLWISVDDFRNSGWRDALENAREESYCSYWQALSKAAQNANEATEAEKRKVLWLLADACSMMLKPESHQNPFRPMISSAGGRSALPEDFDDSDISFFENMLNEIDDVRLKARLSDILWLIRSPKNVEHAKTAIDAYLQFSLEPDSFFKDGKDAWKRAIKLALMLGAGANDKVEHIWNTLVQTFKALESTENAHGAFLSDLLDEREFGEREPEFEEIAEKLEALAGGLRDKRNFYLERKYYERAIIWQQKLNNETEVYRLITQVAESYTSEAQFRIEGERPSHLVARQLLEEAIQTYRSIPRQHRQDYSVDEKIAELRQKMSESNELALSELSEISTEEADISSFVERSKNLVSNKAFPEVLFALSNVCSGVDVDKIRSEAENNIQQFPLRTLFSSTHIAPDGRVAARSPGVNPEDLSSDESQQVIWNEMLFNYGILIGITAQGCILPGLRSFNLEHRVTEVDLFEVCRGSSEIPFGRQSLWAKGLYFGFEYDFISSTHILAPQVEHFVRTLMKQNDLTTTTLDSQGIETEKGLSKLLVDPEIEQVLDKHKIFEFKALLSDPVGSNLRNKIAHGLFEPSEGSSTYSIYFWWLCLRLVVNSIPWKPREDDVESTST